MKVIRYLMGAFVCFCFSCYSVYAEPRYGSLYSISKLDENQQIDLTAINIQRLNAYKIFRDLSRSTGNINNQNNAYDYLNANQTKYFGGYTNTNGARLMEGTATYNTNYAVNELTLFNNSATNSNTMSRNYYISAGQVFDIIILSNSVSYGQSLILNNVFKMVTNTGLTWSTKSLHYEGFDIYILDIVNTNNTSTDFGMSLLPNNTNEDIWYQPLYFGERNYIPRDLYDICFPTSPEVDAINYKADRIIEALQSSNYDLTQVINYLEQLHVLNGSMDNKLNTLSDIYITDTFIESGVNEANDNLEIVQEKIDTTNENIENLTNEDIAESSIDTGIDDAEQEVNDNLFLPVLQSPIAIQSSPTTWLDYFTVVPETSRVGLPCPFKPQETFYVDFGAFFEYNEATRIFFTFIRWFLRYRVIIAAGDYLIKAIERLLGVAIISEFLPRMKV